MSKKVLCCGEAVCNIIFTDIPMELMKHDTTFMHDFDMELAGDAAVTARSVSEKGVETSLFACVNDDVFGMSVRSNLEACGINTEYIYAPEGNVTPVNLNFNDVQGLNHIAAFAGAKAGFSLTGLPEKLTDYDLVYIDGFAAQDMGSVMGLMDKEPDVKLLVKGEEGYGLFLGGKNYELPSDMDAADAILRVLEGQLPE